MNAPDSQRTDPREAEEIGTSHLDADQASRGEEKKGHGRWMMIACCVPMLAIAIVLAATGVVGAGFIVAAVACTAMMAAMMVGMSGGAGGGDGGGR